MGSLTGKTVLIVDDAEDVRVLARKILQGDGAEVLEASSIDQALELARAKAPHLIITDLGLPGKTGFDLLVARQTEAALSPIPTIVLSGMKDRESIVKAVGLGATDYILKPFRATLILQKVRKALKATSFLTRTLAAAESPIAICTVGAEIIGISEVGCQIESPIKIPGEGQIQLSAEILKTLELDRVVMRALSQDGRYTAAGRYISEINFIGVDHELATKVRAKLGSGA